MPKAIFYLLKGDYNPNFRATQNGVVNGILPWQSAWADVNSTPISVLPLGRLSQILYKQCKQKIQLSITAAGM